MNGRRAPVATVASPGDFGFYIPDVWEEKAFLPIYRRLARARAKHPALAAVRSMYAQHDRDPRPPRAAGRGGQARLRLRSPIPTPTSGRASATWRACSGAGFGTRVATISTGAASTPTTRQPEAHADLLQDLGDSLRAWQADLDARGLSHRVLTLVWSEFGRRPEDNDSGGTDHGAGGLLLLVGNRANGGIRSEFPGLARLDADDNLIVTTDFRTVYASLLECWLGVEAARVLPRCPGGRLPLLRAA